MVFFFEYSNVLYRHVAKDPVKFFKFSQILENLLENIMAAKGFLPQAWSLSFERFLPKILDFLKNLLLNILYNIKLGCAQPMQIIFSKFR